LGKVSWVTNEAEVGLIIGDLSWAIDKARVGIVIGNVSWVTDNASIFLVIGKRPQIKDNGRVDFVIDSKISGFIPKKEKTQWPPATWEDDDSFTSSPSSSLFFLFDMKELSYAKVRLALRVHFLLSHCDRLRSRPGI